MQRWEELREKKLFGNPPYSRGHQGNAAQKARAAAERGKTTCLILQATTDTVWFHDSLMGGADLIAKQTISGGPLEGLLLRFEATRCRMDVHLLKGRVKFIEPSTGKPAASSGKFGTLIAVWFPRLRW